MLLIQQCFLILVWLTLLKLNLSKFLHTYYLCIKLSPINCELSIANSYTSWFKDFSTSLTWALEKSLSLLPIQTHCVKLFRKEQSYFSSSSYLITIFSNFSWISCKNAGTYQKKGLFLSKDFMFQPIVDEHEKVFCFILWRVTFHATYSLIKQEEEDRA